MIPKYLEYSYPTGKGVHIGITGSIAAYKSLDLIRELVKKELRVSVSLSKAALKFITPITIKGLGVESVTYDMFSLDSLYSHLYPGYDAEVFAIVPATANIIGKIAHGIADDIISTQALAFDKQILVAPAMNPRMFNAKPTRDNLQKLKSYGIKVIEPSLGEVACGEYGKGRLGDLREIYFQILKSLVPQDLAGYKILITMGPTREFFDPIRFWSNPSSGKMGAALAIAAWLRGAMVTCISGETEVWLPSEITKIEVIAAQDMFDAVIELWPTYNIGCLCAAVCDFRPKNKFTQKFKKEKARDRLLIEFEKNPDILKTLGQKKNQDQILIGFAAETQDNFIELAKEKIIRKNLDFIVVNQINHKNSGFKSDKNTVVIIDKFGNSVDLGTMLKADIAWEIWNRVSKS